MHRRSFVAGSAVATAGLGWGMSARAGSAYRPSAVIAWNRATTSAIATTASGPTVAARALSMVHEAIYNAWASYTSRSIHTVSGMIRRPGAEATVGRKSVAISHAAYGVLVDLFPEQQALFQETFLQAVEGLDTTSVGAITAAQLGQQAAVLLLQARAGDGSNQRGDLAPGAYADWTGYQSVNPPDHLVDPTRWQPLQLTSSSGSVSVQTFLTPHWGRVRPFALTSGSSLRPSLGAAAPTSAEILEVLALSAMLNDARKAQVEFWANNPGSVTPPGQWSQFAEQISAHDGNGIDQDVRMFFILGQAMLDASIAAWDSKAAFDSVRPISLIRHLFAGQTIPAWGGVGTTGPQAVRGEDWMPYQRVTSPSPNFPEYVSGHSSFSGAAASVLGALRGDSFRSSFTIAARGIRFDPTMPTQTMNFGWSTLSAAADAAGYSRRLGGIHFERGDLHGRKLGAAVGKLVSKRAMALITGSSPGSDDDDDD